MTRSAPKLALAGTAASGTIQAKESGGRALPLAVVDEAIMAQWEGSEDMDVDVTYILAMHNSATGKVEPNVTVGDFGACQNQEIYPF